MRLTVLPSFITAVSEMRWEEPSAMNANGQEQRILLIEDDPEIVKKLSSLLAADHGLLCHVEADGATGLQAALTGRYCLMIVDANLPSISGFDICRKVRDAIPSQAILFLTGRSDEIDKVLGLELGADDYVTKPFSPRELSARVKALLRRAVLSAERRQTAPIVEEGNIRIDNGSRRVWVDGQLVALTPIEFEILSLLAGSPGRTFDRGELLRLAFGYDDYTHDESLTVHFSRLRTKIEKDPKSPVYLKTVRGVGYRFRAPDESEA